MAPGPAAGSESCSYRRLAVDDAHQPTWDVAVSNAQDRHKGRGGENVAEQDLNATLIKGLGSERSYCSSSRSLRRSVIVGMQVPSV